MGAGRTLRRAATEGRPRLGASRGPVDHPVRRASRGNRSRDGEDPCTPPVRPRRTSPVVAAEIGLVLEHGGHSGTVVDLTESAAIVEVGSARLRVPFGSEVRVQATTVQLVSPAEGSSPRVPTRST